MESTSTESVRKSGEMRESKSNGSIEHLPLDQLDLKAKNTIQNHMWASAGVGLLPIPVLDFAGIMGLQLHMVKALADIYEVPFRKDIGKSIITSLVGSVMPMGFAAPLAGIVKIVPFLGNPVSYLAYSATCSASTYAVGGVFAQHFAAGGTLLDFEPETVREYFREKFQEGKQMVNSAGKKTVQ